MPAEYLACPYCNTPLPPRSVATNADRLPCPSCGEMIPASRWPVGAPAEAVATLPVTPARKRSTALILVGIMLGMGVLALGFALYTIDVRQQRHPQPKEVAPEVVFHAPQALEGLAYLPPDYQGLAGLHLRELLQAPEGRTLLAEPRPAGLDAVLRPLLKTTGLKLEQIDHVVAAIQLDKRFTRATVVIRTILPYDQTAVSKAVQPAKGSLRDKRPLFQFDVSLGEGYLWCVEERTLTVVLALQTPGNDSLVEVPAEPQPTRTLPSPLLQQLMTQRLDQQSQLWLAADLERATVLYDYVALMGGVPKDWQPLTRTKALALGLLPRAGLTLLGQFYTGDAKATRAVSELLESRRWPAAQSYKVEGPPPNEQAAEAQWVTLQVRAEAETVRGLFEKLPRR